MPLLTRCLLKCGMENVPTSCIYMNLGVKSGSISLAITRRFTTGLSNACSSVILTLQKPIGALNAQWDVYTCLEMLFSLSHRISRNDRCSLGSLSPGTPSFLMTLRIHQILWTHLTKWSPTMSLSIRTFPSLRHQCQLCHVGLCNCKTFQLLQMLPLPTFILPSMKTSGVASAMRPIRCPIRRLLHSPMHHNGRKCTRTK